jgi:putative ubiquitin-RnfH superfamily antitoxin RatB of RatAB toxin-antitoxin module
MNINARFLEARLEEQAQTVRIVLNERDRLIRDFLRAGASVEDAAKAAGLAETTIRRINSPSGRKR